MIARNAFFALALASCISDPSPEPTGTSEQAATADQLGKCEPTPPPSCTDPETEAGVSYVSIGVMPSPYPIDWSSPFNMFVSTLGSTCASAGLDRSHSIGHVLLKVRCGNDEPFYISQTGANGPARQQFFDTFRQKVNYLFVTQLDGKLYTDAEAKADWDASEKAQRALPDGTYTTDPDSSKISTSWSERRVVYNMAGMGAVKTAIDNLAPATRHRFLRATIKISETQCRAIRTWKNAYVATGGSSRYSLHRAPWVTDNDGTYDGGGCGSVSFAGAFYASGLDYRQAATRTTERLEVGTSRLTAPLARETTIPSGWYNVQNVTRYVPGDVPCATNTPPTVGSCYGKGLDWDDSHWKAWNGGLRWQNDPKDTTFTFSNAWGTGAAVAASTVPLIVFEPERFYKEILNRWNAAGYDAFRYGDWCKIDGKVPTIVRDGSAPTAANENAQGRPEGLKNGFANPEVQLFK